MKRAAEETLHKKHKKQKHNKEESPSEGEKEIQERLTAMKLVSKITIPTLDLSEKLTSYASWINTVNAREWSMNSY